MVRDILMWVGAKYYPHIVDFVEEAQLKGVCKRVPAVPDITPGESRCYLLHRDGGRRPRCFGYFVINEVAVLVTPETSAALAEKYGLTRGMKERSDFPEGPRGCGEMVTGGCYIVSVSVWKATNAYFAELPIYNDLVLHSYPFPKLPVQYPNFRGISYIEREAFLGGLTWLKRDWKSLAKRAGKLFKHGVEELEPQL